jgi:hypothetical protein
MICIRRYIASTSSGGGNFHRNKEQEENVNRKADKKKAPAAILVSAPLSALSPLVTTPFMSNNNTAGRIAFNTQPPVMILGFPQPAAWMRTTHCRRGATARQSALTNAMRE